jgi:pyridoxamine 5'-phosphate oxidase
MFDLYHLRKEYIRQGLTRNLLNKNPFEQFRVWFNDAVKTKIKDSHAMVLATAGKDGRPSARMVLLKNFDASGFTFYTNYESRKGRNLKENPYATLLFPWNTMERQVRIEGYVQKVSESESNTYFSERPAGSQIGAWASDQSREIPSRKYLNDMEQKYAQQFSNQPVSRPPHWGGYRLVPDRFEFWQGRENRLHDRFEYYLEKEEWKIRRLAP